MQIRSKELKRLRAVVTGTFKHIKLILNTIEQFGWLAVAAVPADRQYTAL